MLVIPGEKCSLQHRLFVWDHFHYTKVCEEKDLFSSSNFETSRSSSCKKVCHFFERQVNSGSDHEFSKRGGNIGSSQKVPS